MTTDWELTSFDPASETATYARWEDGRYMVKTTRPVGGTLRVTHEMRSTAKADWGGDYHHVAAVPANVFFNSDLAQAAGEHDEAYLRRWLNDIDNSAWRTKEGRL